MSFDLDVYTARCLKQQSYFIDDWKNMLLLFFFSKGVVHCLIFTRLVLCVLKQLNLIWRVSGPLCIVWSFFERKLQRENKTFSIGFGLSVLFAFSCYVLRFFLESLAHFCSMKPS